jgi:putative DNA primase/helicase
MVEATEMGPVAPAEAFIRTAAAAAEVVEFSDYTEDSGGSVIERCSIYPQNDIGNAKRLREHYGTRLMWVPGRGWYAWIGSHWSRADGARLAQIWAQRVAGLIRKEVKVLEAGGPLADELPADFAKRLQARAKWSVTSGMAPRLKAMLEVLAPMVSVEVDELDQLRYAFNVENGTLDLMIEDDGADKVGRWALRPHDPADRITNLAPVSYADGAEAPRWRQFVSEVQPVYEDALYLQRMAGYGLTGETREEKVFLSYGEGSNGKSTYWEVVGDLMGTYAVVIPPEIRGMLE